MIETILKLIINRVTAIIGAWILVGLTAIASKGWLDQAQIPGLEQTLIGLVGVALAAILNHFVATPAVSKVLNVVAATTGVSLTVAGGATSKKAEIAAACTLFNDPANSKAILDHENQPIPQPKGTP